MKILFITSNRIGDAVLTTGVLASLLDEHAGAEVTVACGPAPAPLFAAVPGLRRVHALRKCPLNMHWIDLWAACATTRWTVVADMRGTALARLLLAGRRLAPTLRNPAVHRLEELAEGLGLSSPPAPVLWISDEDRARAAALVPPGERFIAIGPMANWGGKQWRAERFAELARRAVAATGPFPGARVAIFGAEDERPQAGPLFERLAGVPYVDLVGESLTVAAAAIERAAIYVGNDSGLMHVAAATGTPTLGLFGPSRDVHYAPWGPHCAVVRTVESYDELVGEPGFDFRAAATHMDGLSVDRAYDALVALVARQADRLRERSA